ncbi:MAG: hypothetical protein D8M59_11235 [Planctomycetes bacterium]|nr:hypothetical protein [Planctomycetota bacterium]NOG54075.1 hypothetical protein [Planctomycetota bacterium]
MNQQTAHHARTPIALFLLAFAFAIAFFAGSTRAQDDDSAGDMLTVTAHMYPLTGVNHTGLALVDTDTVALAGLNESSPQTIELLTLGTGDTLPPHDPLPFTFKQIAAAEAGTDNTLWVCDTLDSRLLVFDLKKRKLTQAVDTAGMPIKMRIAFDGTVWYITRDLKVHRYTTDGRTYLLVDTASQPITVPADVSDIALAPTGDVMYVACLSPGRIMRIDLTTGATATHTRDTQTPNDQARVFSSVDVNHDGELFVCDTARNLILQYGPDGRHIQNIPPFSFEFSPCPSMVRVSNSTLICLASQPDGTPMLIRATITNPDDVPDQDGSDIEDGSK